MVTSDCYPKARQAPNEESSLLLDTLRKTGGLKNCFNDFTGIVGYTIGVDVQAGDIVGDQIF